MTSPPDLASITALEFDEAVSLADVPALCEPWRVDFGESASWVGRRDVEVPKGEALSQLCEAYGFPEVATRLLALHRDDWDDPRARRLGAHVQWMVARRYSPAGYIRLGWPPVFSRSPLFYAYAALGLSRKVAAEQVACGIDVEVTRDTLWDIGQQVALHQRVHHEVGMKKGWWLSHHLSHHLHRLGRLQFQRGRARRAPGPIGSDEPFLDVHIPEDGPLDPDACDASFTRARSFFAEHFPDERVRFHACTSWLLDPVLAELLPVDSNIPRFQARFELHELREGPSSVFEFVYDRPDLDRVQVRDLSSLPRDTRLRRVIADHYERGGVIRMGVGTRPL